VIVRHDVVGTYNMNNDCSFTATFTDENGSVSNIFGSMDGAGSELVFIYKDPGLVIAGFANQALPVCHQIEH